MENLSLNRIKELEFFAVEGFVFLVSETLNRKRSQIQKLGIGEVFIWHIELSQIDVFVIRDIEPPVGENGEVVVLSGADSSLSFFDFIWNEEGKQNSLIIFDSLSFGSHVLLQQLEIFLVEDLGFIVDYEPEWLVLAVPSVAPLKVGNESNLYF